MIKETWKVLYLNKREGHTYTQYISLKQLKEIGKIKHAHFKRNGRLKGDDLKERCIEYKATITSHIPGEMSKKRGVITGIPMSVSIEEIKNSLKGGDIVDAKRLTKGKEK